MLNDGKRPHGNPLDMPKARCQQLRKLASDQGIDIYAVAGNNDFSSPIPEHRESQLVYLRELMRMTSDLGAKIVRFPRMAGRNAPARRRRQLRLRQVGVAIRAPGLLRRADLGMVPASLSEAAALAGDFGVTLALQNHPPVIKDMRTPSAW